MSDYMKEAERLIECLRCSMTAGSWDEYRAALLAHIQRGAVPEGWQVVPKVASDAMLRPFYECPPEELQLAWQAAVLIAKTQAKREAALQNIVSESERLGLYDASAAPAPDHFRDAAKMMAEPIDSMGAPVSCGKPLCSPNDHHVLCRQHEAPAEVPMPEPVARMLEWRGRLTINPPSSARTFEEFPPSEAFPANKGAYWSDGMPLVLANEVRAYGAACEAVGYARGLAEGVARTGLTPAEHDVLAERHRQISAEGWTPEHDDGLRAGDLPMAAACYAAHAGTSLKTLEYSAAQSFVRQCWPWSPVWWKPTAPRRDLVKAAALLLAEIERLDRAALRGEVKP